MIVGNRAGVAGDLQSIDANQIADLEGTVATVLAGAIAALLIVRVTTPAAFDRARRWMAGLGTGAAAAVAVAATAGSLWFSEGAHFPPCKLCWYQRIAMYPLAVLLPIAAIRRDRAIRPYAMVLAAAGLAVSAWHISLEAFPDQDLGGCDPTNPCTIRWVEGLGVWTIPRMAAVAFATVLALLILDRTDDGADP